VGMLKGVDNLHIRDPAEQETIPRPGGGRSRRVPMTRNCLIPGPRAWWRTAPLAAPRSMSSAQVCI
jgi:hypothetical protein